MFSWRCFPFVESAPRAYRLKASNAAPLSSTSAGTFPVLDQVTDFRTITAWLHGFYSGRRNNTVVDVQAVQRIADKVEEYCRSHRDMALMQAVETTLGGAGRAVGSKK